MGEMIDHIYSMLLMAIAALCLSSCDVHEFPHEEEPSMLLLDFSDASQMPVYKTLEYGNGNATNAARLPQAFAGGFDVRHTIVAYAVDNSGKTGDAPALRMVVTRQAADGLNTAVNVGLGKGKYVFYVWTDYVARGTTADLYYDTSSLSDITYLNRNEYHGSDDMRDAFRGETTALLGDGNTTATVRMERPLGKFVFVSDDASRLSVKELQSYTVVFRYCGYMPSVFSLFQNKPTDAWQGMAFSSGIKMAEQNEAVLGFDYVMMNGKETTVPVSLEIYDGEKRKVAATNPIDVPLKRNGLTVVRGQFLTSKENGGVDIKVDFDGEYDYEAY